MESGFNVRLTHVDWRVSIDFQGADDGGSWISPSMRLCSADLVPFPTRPTDVMFVGKSVVSIGRRVRRHGDFVRDRRHLALEADLHFKRHPLFAHSLSIVLVLVCFESPQSQLDGSSEDLC